MLKIVPQDFVNNAMQLVLQTVHFSGHSELTKCLSKSKMLKKYRFFDYILDIERYGEFMLRCEKLIEFRQNRLKIVPQDFGNNAMQLVLQTVHFSGHSELTKCLSKSKMFKKYRFFDYILDIERYGEFMLRCQKLIEFRQNRLKIVPQDTRNRFIYVVFRKF
jgi:ribosome-associated toxin RatA of RatAB toxin-antitoxin module